MKNKKSKYFAIAGTIILLLALAILSACNSPTKDNTNVVIDGTVYTVEEIQALEDASYNEGVGSVDITTDNQGAIDTAIAALPVTDVTTPVVDETPVEEVQTEKYSTDLNLGDDIELNLDDNDVEGLVDSSVEFDDQNVDVKEYIVSTSDLQVGYSGSNSYEEDFGVNPYVVALTRNAVGYELVFENDVELDQISEDTPLEVSFLGKDMSITNADDESITFFTSPSQYLKVNDVVTSDEKTLTLLDVSEDAIMVDVNGVTSVVNEGTTKTVNGLKIYVESTFARSTKAESSAVLVFGTDSKQTINSGDYYGDDELWVWNIETDGSNLLSLSVILDEKFNKLDSDIKALGVGECLSFPEEYVKLCFTKTNEPDYTNLDIAFDEIDVEGTDVKVVAIRTSDDVFEVGSENLNEIFVGSDGTIYYEDGNDYVATSSTEALINLNDAEYILSFESGQIVITDEDSNWITIDTNIDNQRLGDVENDAEISDVLYNGAEIGTKDNILTAFGVKMLSIESNAESDEVELALPDEKLEVTLGII